jgi:hypothetical protein
MVKPKDKTECAKVTYKAIFGRQDVVGGGMSGKQIGVSGETCAVQANGAGVRTRIVPQWRKPRKSQVAKLRRGKVGRKEDA